MLLVPGAGFVSHFTVSAGNGQLCTRVISRLLYGCPRSGADIFILLLRLSGTHATRKVSARIFLRCFCVLPTQASRKDEREQEVSQLRPNQDLARFRTKPHRGSKRLYIPTGGFDSFQVGASIPVYTDRLS